MSKTFFIWILALLGAAPGSHMAQARTMDDVVRGLNHGFNLLQQQQNNQQWNDYYRRQEEENRRAREERQREDQLYEQRLNECNQRTTRDCIVKPSSYVNPRCRGVDTFKVEAETHNCAGNLIGSFIVQDTLCSEREAMRIAETHRSCRQ